MTASGAHTIAGESIFSLALLLFMIGGVLVALQKQRLGGKLVFWGLVLAILGVGVAAMETRAFLSWIEGSSSQFLDWPLWVRWFLLIWLGFGMLLVFLRLLLAPFLGWQRAGNVVGEFAAHVLRGVWETIMIPTRLFALLRSRIGSA